MVTIEGKSLKSGVGIATAAVVDAKQGMGGVSPDLLMEGVRALRAMLPPREHPDAVVASDTLALGMSLKLPGINTVGIAIESPDELPGLEPKVPCVIGCTDLIRSISEGDVLIVDGDEGVVYIDPDLETILRYQEMEERAIHEHVVYIAAEHLPARTPEGEIVNVLGIVHDEASLAIALSQGADGVLTDIADLSVTPSALLRVAAGKPIVILAEAASEELARAIEEFSVPGQVTVLGAVDGPEPRKSHQWPVFAATAEPGTQHDGEGVIVMLGSNVDDIISLIEQGARAVAVSPKLVSVAKNTIRAMAEEIEE